MNLLILAAFSGAARAPLRNIQFSCDRELGGEFEATYAAGTPGKNPIRKRTRNREPQIMCINSSPKSS